MNFFKLEGLKKTFKFLQVFLEAEARDARVDVSRVHSVLENVSVEKADEALLAGCASEDRYSWSGGPGHHDYWLASAVWLHPSATLENSIMDFERRSQIGSGGEGIRHYSAPTLGEQLARFQMEEGESFPDFIVIREKEDHDDWGRGDVTRRIIIRPMGKFPLSDYFARRVDDAAREIKAELARACPIE